MLRSHRPAPTDLLVALVVLAIALFSLVVSPAEPGFRRPDTWAVVAALFQAVPLLYRRHFPGSVFGIVLAASVSHFLLGYPATTGAVAGALVATYGAASYGRNPVSRLALATGLVAVAVVVGLGAATGRGTTIIDAGVYGGLIAVAWVLGDRARTRRAYTAALAQRAAEAERTREVEAAAAVAAERSHIARELHDIVAHSVSTIVLHAGAAKQVLDSDPRAARQSLDLIETVGRDSVSELRVLLDALRTEESTDGEPLEPQARTRDLSRLVDHARAAGIDVRLKVEGHERTLPAPVDISVYRVAQEAIANTIKHSRARSAEIVLRFDDECLVLHVTDDGTGPRSQTRSGYGLIGMQERVALLGGRIRFGPRQEGGFEVLAVLPLEGTA